MSVAVCFGEILLRLSTQGGQRFGQATQWDAHFGGAEANAAVMIAQLGGQARFVSALPENELAQHAIEELRGLRVGTEDILRTGSRMGVYFLEPGASQRATKIIYDRAHSAIAEALPQDFDWERILSGADWFHWSGITPALSGSAAQMASDATRTARRMGVKVSFDMNYRAKLWTVAEAGRVLEPLMDSVDVLLCGPEEARSVLGAEGHSEAAVACWLQQRYGCATVAITRRRADTADQTRWAATLFSGEAQFESREYDVAIVDRVGAGDSFTGALIYSMMRGDEPQKSVEFAVAASALKHTIRGDYNLVSLAEVEGLAAGGHGGRVQR